MYLQVRRCCVVVSRIMYIYYTSLRTLPPKQSTYHIHTYKRTQIEHTYPLFFDPNFKKRNLSELLSEYSESGKSVVAHSGVFDHVQVWHQPPSFTHSLTCKVQTHLLFHSSFTQFIHIRHAKIQNTRAQTHKHVTHITFLQTLITMVCPHAHTTAARVRQQRQEISRKCQWLEPYAASL